MFQTHTIVLVVTASNPAYKEKLKYLELNIRFTHPYVTWTKLDFKPKHKVKHFVLIIDDSKDNFMLSSPLFRITIVDNRNTSKKSIS